MQIFSTIISLALVLGTFGLVVVTSWMTCETRRVANYNLKLVEDSNQANERAEKQFVGQNKPLIEVTPIGISQDEPDKCITFFSVLNYSGFKAREILIDIRYGDPNNAWLGEWDKAHIDANDKEDACGVEIDKIYFSAPKKDPNVYIQELISGGSVGNSCKKNHKFVEDMLTCEISKHPHVRGAIILDNKFGEPNNSTFSHPVFVRVSWQNEKGHIFDEIHEYELIGTKDNIGKEPNTWRGRAFTFIPKGVISNKGKE